MVGAAPRGVPTIKLTERINSALAHPTVRCMAAPGKVTVKAWKANDPNEKASNSRTGQS